MSIVAISETAGSLGNEIGRRLAESLAWSFADREIIAKAAERFHEDPMELRHRAEEKPSLWERFSDSHRRYKAFIEATIFDMAAGGNVVLAGLASTLVLRDIRHVVRVRTQAPEHDRARRLEQQQGLTADAALDIVRQTDRERAARVRFLYHVDADNPLLYDLVLNTERMTADQGARLLREAVEAEQFQSTEASRAAFNDLNVVVQARALFLAHPTLGGRQLFVSCRHGVAWLSGAVEVKEERQAAEAIVVGIPGVKNVLNEIVVLPPRGRLHAS